MRKDEKARYDGLTVVRKGVHSATAPVALPRDQLAWGINLDMRTDFVRPRAGKVRRLLKFLDSSGNPDAALQALFEDAIFEGAAVFERAGRLVTLIGGHLFAINPLTWAVTDVTPVTSVGPPVVYDANPSNRYRAWFCEAENWMIVQDGQSIPLIYDGASAVRSDTLGVNGKPQVPIGKAMVYSQGRLTVSYANQREFVIGDIVGGASGTPAFGFKDAVLYFTENNVINGGGSFSVPINAGLITAFRPVAQVDTSTGQGPTQVFTTGGIFSMNLPYDRTTWATVNFPIGTVSNVNNGATSDRCTPNVNGDIWFWALDGVRSFLVARREFQTWVNAPLSHEVERVVATSDQNLLGYASGVTFDNRLLLTTRPYRVWNHGIVHQGLMCLDFEPVTSLSERNPLPTWLGIQTGLLPLQVFGGTLSGVDHCFVFALSSASKIELWEVTRDALFDDAGSGNVPIQWAFETKVFSFQQEDLPGRELLSLDGGRLFVDEIEGTCTFTLYYRADEDPCWHLWHSWQVCASLETCDLDEANCETPPTLQAQYRKPFWLPDPNSSGRACDPANDKPYNVGREFQVRAEITGRCRVKMLELIAHDQEEDVSGVCAGNEECVATACCPPNDWAYSIESVIT